MILVVSCSKLIGIVVVRCCSYLEETDCLLAAQDFPRLGMGSA